MVPYRQKKISHQTKTSKSVYKHMVLQRNEMKSENIAKKWKRAYGYDTWATQHRIILSITLGSLLLLVLPNPRTPKKKNTKNKVIPKTTMMKIVASSVSNFIH